MTLLLSNEDIDEVLTVEMALEAVERSQIALAEGQAISSPRVDTLAPASRPGVEGTYGLKSMAGIFPEAGVAALRIDSDVLVWPSVAGNVRRDRLATSDGRWNGLLLLFTTETGEPIMISPDGYISRMRVGVTNGLAARHLAREDARAMALLGTGWQAGGQLMAHCAVRPLEEVRVFSPNPDNRERFCRELQPRVVARLVPVGSADEAVEDADIVATATNSMEPVHQKRWLRPGVHYSVVKVQEVDEDFLRTVDRAFLFSKNPVTTRPQFYALPPVGAAEKRSGWWVRREESYWSELGQLPDLLTGKTPGRQREDESTLFVNNVGQGLQFAAVAKQVYDEALRRGIGRVLPTEWFTQTVHP